MTLWKIVKDLDFHATIKPLANATGDCVYDGTDSENGGQGGEAGCAKLIDADGTLSEVTLDIDQFIGKVLIDATVKASTNINKIILRDDDNVGYKYGAGLNYATTHLCVQKTAAGAGTYEDVNWSTGKPAGAVGCFPNNTAWVNVKMLVDRGKLTAFALAGVPLGALGWGVYDLSSLAPNLGTSGNSTAAMHRITIAAIASTNNNAAYLGRLRVLYGI